MVMQSAVGHQKNLPARNLAVEHTTNVKTGFAYEIPTQFDDQLRFRQSGCGAFRDLRQIVRDWREVERFFAGKIRNAQATAKIENARPTRRVLAKR